MAERCQRAPPLRLPAVRDFLGRRRSRPQRHEAGVIEPSPRDVIRGALARSLAREDEDLAAQGLQRRGDCVKFALMF